MRAFWLTARIALIFAFLLILTVGGVVWAGRHTVGEVFKERLAMTMASEGLLMARLAEQELDEELSEELAHRIVRNLAMSPYQDAAIYDVSGNKVAFTAVRPEVHDFHPESEQLPCEDRVCLVDPFPFGVTKVPLFRDGEHRGSLEIWRAGVPEPDFDAFHHAVALIGLFALLSIAGLSISLTRPIRRMSASMDRIAQGELDHRVVTRGRGEVALMSRSFNAMADRVCGMLRAQKEMLAGASHELRSPLARMKLSIEMLRAKGESPRLDALDGEVDALDALVEELLVASRLDLGSTTLKPEVVPVEKLAKEAWQRVEVEATELGVALELDIAPAAGEVTVDRPLGVRILGNLFENAVRYGAGAPVTLSTESLGSRVKVTVSDRGPGVSQDQIEHIFEAFFRADSSRSRKTGGVGLGLMIVKRAVEAHGGDVLARPNKGSGLAITFDLRGG